MNNYILMYRLTCDSGNAPCIFENNYNETKLLTLSCCKGGYVKKNDTKVFTGLRVKAKNIISNGDNVFLVGVFKDKILYVAEITKIITMEEYYNDKQYSNRLDFIYDVVDKNDGYILKRNDKNELFHPKEDLIQHKKDELGKYVLMSTNFSYLGKDYSKYLLSDIEKSILPKNRETKVYSNNDEKYKIGEEIVKRYLKLNSNKIEPCIKLKINSKSCNQK